MRALCYLGNPVLRKVCKEVTEITPDVKRIAKELEEVVMSKDGAGLAAPQIGYDTRIFVVRVGQSIEKMEVIDPVIFINPRITKKSDETCSLLEGCLSVPGLFEEVVRPCTIDVTAMGVDGKEFTLQDVKGWMSRCIQHEVDHLDGIMFFDLLEPDVKEKIKSDLDLIEQKYHRLPSVPGNQGLQDL